MALNWYKRCSYKYDIMFTVNHWLKLMLDRLNISISWLRAVVRLGKKLKCLKGLVSKETVVFRRWGVLQGQILSDERVTLETSAFESLYVGQFTLSAHLIKPNYLPSSLWWYFSYRLKGDVGKVFYFLSPRLWMGLIPSFCASLSGCFGPLSLSRKHSWAEGF